MKGFSQRAGLKLLLVRGFINLSRSKQENLFSNEIRLGFHYRINKTVNSTEAVYTV
jgi:hypothetical protein